MALGKPEIILDTQYSITPPLVAEVALSHLSEGVSPFLLENHKTTPKSVTLQEDDNFLYASLAKPTITSKFITGIGRPRTKLQGMLT